MSTMDSSAPAVDLFSIHSKINPNRRKGEQTKVVARVGPSLDETLCRASVTQGKGIRKGKIDR
jgi:hypothetical protein